MGIVEVFLANSVLCIGATCHPVLVGPRTPTGEYTLSLRKISAPQYGGDVLEFAKDGPRAIFAIHRPPSHRRRHLLTLEKRPQVTLGCINATDALYERLKDCCVGHILKVHP